MRRTWNVDITFPDGLLGPPVADVRGRDLRVDANGEGDVVDELTARLEIDATNTIVAIDAPRATTTRLEGLKGVAIRGGFGRELRERMADDAARRSLSFCVLEDLGGAYVISGYAHLEAGVFEQTREMADLAAATQADVCIGWAAAGELVGNMRTQGRTPVRIGPVAPDISGDALSWHEMADFGSTTVRRRRRTDVVAPTVDAGLRAQQHFRDSHFGGDVETVMHEYLVDAAFESNLRLASLDIVPRVLPWRECPGAVAGAQRLVGAALDELSGRVRTDLVVVESCTHLSSTLRTLADVSSLVSALDC